tara:strand:- start:1881 stop:2087 length:207 start_codon:yes stop_codon:yes gene_type:complete
MKEIKKILEEIQKRLDTLESKVENLDERTMTNHFDKASKKQIERLRYEFRNATDIIADELEIERYKLW